MLKSIVPILWFATACTQPASPAPGYAFAFVAAADDGGALAKVGILVEGRQLGVTDAQGRLKTVLGGSEGQRLSVGVECPGGFDSPPKPLTITLRRFESVRPTEVPETTLRVVCRAKTRSVVIPIRTGHVGLPILYDGAEVARTGEGGVAHVMLRRPTDSSFRLTIDTRSRPELKPQSPSRTFAVASADSFAVWDQLLEQPKPRRRVRRRKAAKPRPAAPYRLQ